jgi:hypothetical protein
MRQDVDEAVLEPVRIRHPGLDVGVLLTHVLGGYLHGLQLAEAIQP